MKTIREEIQAQKDRLVKLLSLLRLTTPETSDEMTPRIVLLTREITGERNRMHTLYAPDELAPLEAEFSEIAKQISEKFEYIATNFKNKLVQIRRDQACLQNKRKLNQYYR